MSNFINDRINLFREKFKYFKDINRAHFLSILIRKGGRDLEIEADSLKEVEAFLKSSLESLIEDIENGLPEYRIANYEENNYEAGYNEALSQIQTLLKSYKQSL